MHQNASIITAWFCIFYYVYNKYSYFFKTNSDQNIYQNARDCINHFKFCSGSMTPNSLGCVQLISLVLYECRILSKYIQNASIVACFQKYI